MASASKPDGTAAPPTRRASQPRAVGAAARADRRPAGGARAALYLTWGQAYTLRSALDDHHASSSSSGSAAAALALPDGHARAVSCRRTCSARCAKGTTRSAAPARKPAARVDLVMHEINALGDTLQRQRTEAVESTALLTSVMGAIDVAVFAFDMDEKLVLVNPAGERLLGQAGRDAARARTPRELRLDAVPRGRNAAAARSAVRPGERPPRAAAHRRSAATASRTSCWSSPT